MATEERINIFACRNIGFLLQYFAVGMIYGGLPATVYGFFLGYLNVPAYIYATASVITALPWSFKFFFGLLNDCVPIRGYRRKPYMVLGWAMCAAVLIGLSQKPLPAPYYCRGGDGGYLKTAPPCNPDAQNHGGDFAMLMCLAALGYVVADVAADGLMVEFAQREPEATRGSTQTTIYLVRALGVVVATALVGLCMNGREYNGTFDWSLSFSQICGILALPAALMVPVSWLAVPEERVEPSERKRFRTYAVDAWSLLRSRAAFFVVMCQFWDAFISGIKTTAGGLVKKEWAGVEVLQQQIFTLVGQSIFALGLWQVKKRFLNYSWRKMLFITTVMLNVLDSLMVYLTIFGVVCNQYFYLGETVLDDIPAAVNFVVYTFIIVQMADVGNDGMVYGLLTTIHNLGTPFSRAVGNQIFGLFTPDLSDGANYIADTGAFRRAVTWSFGATCALSVAPMLLLLLLPGQKPEAQRRKRAWPRGSWYGRLTLALVSAAFAYSVTVNFMTMSRETARLKFVGGQACG